VKKMALGTAALFLGASLLFAPLLLAAPVRADGAAPPGYDANSTAWAQRLAEAHGKLEAARTEVVSAQAALDRARNRQYPTGDALAKLEKDLADAKEKLATREAEWPQLLEQAREAGVLPAVLRPYEN
jgi:septal ring factor EnvC (AmiA/AmiB activator)